MNTNIAATKRLRTKLKKTLKMFRQLHENGAHESFEIEKMARAEILKEKEVLTAMEVSVGHLRARLANRTTTRDALREAQRIRIQAESRYERELERSEISYARRKGVRR